MKKILLILIVLLMFVGCGKKKEEGPTIADDEVILENIMYKLNQDENGYGINYKIASNFRKVDSGNALNYYSEKIDNQSYFVIRVFRYKNKNIDYAIKDTTTQYDNKYVTKIGDLDYTVVHFINPIGENVETNIFYYTYNKNTYVYCFTASIDLTRLEEIFLKQVNYE